MGGSRVPCTSTRRTPPARESGGARQEVGAPVEDHHQRQVDVREPESGRQVVPHAVGVAVDVDAVPDQPRRGVGPAVGRHGEARPRGVGELGDVGSKAGTREVQDDGWRGSPSATPCPVRPMAALPSALTP